MCDDDLNGNTQTISTESTPCHEGTFCDHVYGEFECDSPQIPPTEVTGMTIYFFFSCFGYTGYNRPIFQKFKFSKVSQVFL